MLRGILLQPARVEQEHHQIQALQLLMELWPQSLHQSHEHEMLNRIELMKTCVHTACTGGNRCKLRWTDRCRIVL